MLQVLSWGTGAGLGKGTAETTSVVPKVIKDLESRRIVDIAVGDSHCLALTHEWEVFSWGLFISEFIFKKIKEIFFANI